MDEVNAMMQIMFCELPYIATMYNPVYCLLFGLLFLLTLPGALLHYLFLCCSPVKKRELALTNNNFKRNLSASNSQIFSNYAYTYIRFVFEFSLHRYPEERELRSQGIYTAMGMAILRYVCMHVCMFAYTVISIFSCDGINYQLY